MPTVKTYALLSHTDANAPIYQRVNANQRVRLQKRPVDHAFHHLTFTTEAGEGGFQQSRTIRLKFGSDSIFQDEQIKAGIPANQPYTQAERDALKFTNGFLTTGIQIVQKFLEASPQFDQFKGYCADVRQPLYYLVDEKADIVKTNNDFKRRLKAANKIGALADLEEAQNLIIRLNGTFVDPPKDLETCVGKLIEFLDEADDNMLDALLKDDVTQDEKVNILITRAILDGVISFDAIPNQVAKKKGATDWVPVKLIGNEHSPEDRQRYFAEYLATPEGNNLLTDIKKAMGVKEKKTNGKAEQLPLS